MRPGNQSNKRMRGRGRKGPNPLTRTYESNGPDVKIRGTALHIAEKYQQLARDAQASGDRIMSENYNQHAEHYLRIVASAQAQSQPNLSSSRQDFEETAESGSANGQSGGHGSHERSRSDRHGNGTAHEAPAPVVDEDSPQPFIDSMPTIDAAGQVNGSGSAEAGTDEASAADVEDEKPKRRTRGTRGRGVKTAAAETSEEPAGASEAAPVEEAPVKPKRRYTRRRTKAADESSADSETVAAGE
ncbi:DUF4167 domain-containing protein [Roseibium sp. RKSG952]|uniref:DUF4167 domain-containing protein n=1 Tax=Roseibium sp. RKSG952 TaxID=2529384 RepID=UPI0012BBF9BE|nr:DUF4167 domain-containing protein [Roseibium sp. RKSG952]MTH99247.1 DUF4167 domain-containing protein [Roseibium sp. RKSG952]